MRSNPAEFEFVAPASLESAVKLLAEQKKEWLPIAGGTDVMVQFAAGTLASRKLLSIWNLPELRRIDILPGELQIGAGCTYTDLREDASIAREFPLLAQAASWTGGIANQNRGTLGGNIVNASPAADSLPMLLVYEADLILVSVRGQRRIPCREFYTGYKQLNLAPDELIRAVCLPRRFSGYLSYSRKVGARNAQAISKVCIAALGQLKNEAVADIRIAVGSVAPVPLRLSETEALLRGKSFDGAAIALAKETAAGEISPINDIRSTAAYRTAVVENLIGEFLERLGRQSATFSSILARWNALPAEEAQKEILPCCDSQAWAREMVSRRPITDEAELLAAASEAWRGLSVTDWMEAFRSHPRIGDPHSRNATADRRSAGWSAQEQSAASNSDDSVKRALAEANREYEQRFGHIFIVCATGRSAAEILEILNRRLQNDGSIEIREAAEQQLQITNIRLRKWLTTR